MLRKRSRLIYNPKSKKKAVNFLNIIAALELQIVFHTSAPTLETLRRMKTIGQYLIDKKKTFV